MKLTRKQLMKLINEEYYASIEVPLKNKMNSITLEKDQKYPDAENNVDFMGKPDYEGKMACKQLKRTANMSQSLAHRLEDRENIQLPAWVQSKITKAADYIQIVFNYLDGEIK